MQSAPAVSYPVGRSRFQGWLLGGAVLLGVLAGLLWCEASGLAGWRQGLYALALLAAGGVALHAWQRTPQGHLRWDGQLWHWRTEAASVNGVLAVHLDFQFCLLLSLRTDAGARLWLWPERQLDRPQWHALRCAVFSRRRTAAPDAIEVDPGALSS